MTCTLCVTITGACMEVTTQVCGPTINDLGLNQCVLYRIHCLAYLIESVCGSTGNVCGRECTAVNLSISVLSAYCRNSVDGQWYGYDDSSVEPVPEGEVCTRGAYILFYQRRNSIPAWSASCSLRGENLSPSSLYNKDLIV